MWQGHFQSKATEMPGADAYDFFVVSLQCIWYFIKSFKNLSAISMLIKNQEAYGTSFLFYNIYQDRIFFQLCMQAIRSTVIFLKVPIVNVN